MYMNATINFPAIILVALFVYILYRNKETEENGLPLKLTGYYFLGTLNVDLNGVLIPIGIIISLFLKPTTNKTVKRIAAVTGFIVLMLFYFYHQYR